MKIEILPDEAAVARNAAAFVAAEARAAVVARGRFVVAVTTARRPQRLAQRRRTGPDRLARGGAGSARGAWASCSLM
jgi:6-phosphogluconolactonase/glucosamine-6-phosphate isomerase/deaminase